MAAGPVSPYHSCVGFHLMEAIRSRDYVLWCARIVLRSWTGVRRLLLRDSSIKIITTKNKVTRMAVICILQSLFEHHRSGDRRRRVTLRLRKEIRLRRPVAANGVRYMS